VSWREGDLSPEHWRALEPDLGLAEHVHLQGWGEPLLHPDLPSWAAAARRAGCTVGLTTNGDLLPAALRWLLGGDVGIVTISLAGDAAAHADLRDGSDLSGVLEAAGELVARARERRLRLALQASFLLTRDNAADLPRVVELAARAALDEIFVIHLDCRPSARHARLSAFGETGLVDGVVPFLREAQEKARLTGIRYRGPAEEPDDLLTCALSPLRFAFVDWDGNVGPCVNLMLPVEGGIPRWVDTTEIRVEPLTYGRLPDASLGELLRSGERERFIRPFSNRLEAERRFLLSMDVQPSAETLRRLDEAALRRERDLAGNPFPPACAGCPKASGW
jgi:MoaA/NifB/PqqE/SkfB family radical SAM enzyme